MKKQIAGALAFLGWSFMASACGLISGVSDDYTYERADAAADALPSDASADSRVGDASPDAAPACLGAIPRSPEVAPQCHACFVANCCDAATRCNGSPEAITRCNDYMKCLGGCRPTAASCRLGCDSKLGGGALNQLTTCRGDCPATACAARP